MKVVVMSDTHTMHRHPTIPDGDVFVHCGDFTGRGQLEQLKDVCSFVDDLPHKHKIIIAGNHDRCFENTKTREEAIALVNEVAIYLEDESVIIDGIKFYGSPWQPEFFNWAFNLPRGKALAEKWAMIDEDTDVLITHGPPYGILDKTLEGDVVGCEELRKVVETLPNLKYHLFGHIHEGYGTETINNVTYINASTCTRNYYPTNSLQVFDI